MVPDSIDSISNGQQIEKDEAYEFKKDLKKESLNFMPHLIFKD